MSAHAASRAPTAAAARSYNIRYKLLLGDFTSWRRAPMLLKLTPCALHWYAYLITGRPLNRLMLL